MVQWQADDSVLTRAEAIRILFASFLLNGPWYLSTARMGQKEHWLDRAGQREETLR